MKQDITTSYLIASADDRQVATEPFLGEHEQNKPSPVLKKKTKFGPALCWDIEDLKTALMILNENEEIRHME